MQRFFGTLYIYISNFGMMVSGIVVGIFSAAGKALSFLLKRIFIYPGSRLKKKLGHSLFVVRRILALILIAGIVSAAVLTVRARSVRADAVSVSLNGEEIGYAETEDEALLAKARVLEETGCADTLTLSFRESKANRSDILSTDALCDRLREKTTESLVNCYGLYLGENRIAAVSSLSAAKSALSALLEEEAAVYPNSAVTFVQSIALRRTSVAGSDKVLQSAAELKSYLKASGVLRISHTECEKSFSALSYDTVEIETNQLFIGDSRLRRNGQDGQAFVLKLVTYIGDKPALSENLTEVTVRAPVSRIIERGIRAGSISMGGYTVTQTAGWFCWPVVGLYHVTSNFGYRSLGYHHGLDISGASAEGSLVVAGAPGTVTESGWSAGGYGNYIVISHGNGIETLYGHMQNNSLLVNVGETVTKGQAIGRVGNTGYSFGAHLHFEVRINGVRVDPARYLGLEP